MTPWPKPDPEGLITSDCTDVGPLSSHTKVDGGGPGLGAGRGREERSAIRGQADQREALGKLAEAECRE